MIQKEILKLAIAMGVKADLRGEEAVKKYLARQKKKFEGLSEKKKREFDQERLQNPYTDSGIWVDNGRPVKKALAGIDVTTGSLMMAKSLGFDTYINHHPIGKGLAQLDDVMHLQADVLAMYGVPINIAESLLQPRISEVSRGMQAVNHYQAVDSAKLIGVNLMNVHTPADNLVASFLKKETEKRRPEYVSELIDFLKEVPEYKKAEELGAPIKLIAGSEDRRTGKVAFTEITGGTEGAKNIYSVMSNAGIGTIVAVHLSEEHRKNAEEAHLNVIVASHIASDSLGMNLFLDELEKKEIEIVPCGGLIRVKR